MLLTVSRVSARALFTPPLRWSSITRPARVSCTVPSRTTLPRSWLSLNSRTAASTHTHVSGLRPTRMCLCPAHPVRASCSSDTPPVSEELTQALRQLVNTGDTAADIDDWRPVTALYHALPVALRREHVRPHRSLAQVLHKLRSTLCIELDAAALHYRQYRMGRGPAEDSGRSSNHTPDAHPSPFVCVNRSNSALHSESSRTATGVAARDGGVSSAASPHTTYTAAASAAPSHHSTHTAVRSSSNRSHGNHNTSANHSSGDAIDSVVAASTMPPVDFYYRVALHDIPPPPPDFDITPSALRGAQVSDDGAIVALADLVPHIPPFFVPMREVLSHMPGYTEEHLQRYLLGKAMEAVEVCGERYVRLHGGGVDTIRLDGCEEAEATFAAYKPDVSLLPHWIAAFAGCVDTWLPLRLLLSRVSAEVVAKLPFRGHAAIIYFAQMQHVFAFSLDPACVPAAPNSHTNSRNNVDDVDHNRTHSDTCEEKERAGVVALWGGEGMRDTTAVLLRGQEFCGLDVHTTPVPKSCNYMLDVVAAEATVDVAHVERTLRADIREELVSYFGDCLIRFFRTHAPLFHLSRDGTVVMRRRYYERKYLASLPLEEQLALATQQRDRRRMRVLRRRLTLRDNPAHPLHDRDNLARELSRHLPRKGIVPVRVFCKSLPDEVEGFLPAKRGNFFESYPQYFQFFEYQQPGMWYLAHPDQPLPRGVIRQHFTEAELVKMIAAFLQPRASALCSMVMFHLPRGAQETIRRRHGGAYYFMEKYPQFFGIVIGSSKGNTANSAQVSLIEVPTEATLAEAMRQHNTHGDRNESGEGTGTRTQQEQGETAEACGLMHGGSGEQRRAGSSVCGGRDHEDMDDDE